MLCLQFDNHILLCSIVMLQYFKQLIIYHISQNILWLGKTHHLCWHGAVHPFCVTTWTALTLTAKAISSSRDGIAIEYGVYFLMRGTGNTPAHLLHDQKEANEVLGAIYSLIFLEDYQAQEDKTSVRDLIILWKKPLPLPIFPHTYVQWQHKLVLVLKEQRRNIRKSLRVGMVTTEVFLCQGGFEWCPAPLLVTHFIP